MKDKKIVTCIAAIILASALAQPQQTAQQPMQKSGKHSAAKKTAEKPKRVVTDLSGFDLLEPSKVQGQLTVVGATRGLPRPVALTPRLGKLYGSSPQFAWSYEGKGQDFIFVLRDDAQQEVFRAGVSGETFRYPQDAPALKPEKTYFWTVEVSSPILGSSSSDPSGFLVVSQGQKEEIDKALLEKAKGPDPYKDGLAEARVLTDYRLWYDVVDAYSQLIARYSDHAELYEERGTIYAQLEPTQKLADQDLARAEELQRGTGK
jgi:hypothetical protein